MVARRDLGVARREEESLKLHEVLAKRRRLYSQVLWIRGHMISWVLFKMVL